MSHSVYELSLSEGLRFERRMFHGLFATNDQKEGMSGSLLQCLLLHAYYLRL